MNDINEKYFFDKENNNFSLIKLIAAFMVIYAHSFGIQPYDGQSDIMVIISQSIHSGQLAVFIFIFLSGIFITKSIVDNDDVIEFSIKRLVRIWPPLVVCMIFVICIGGIFTTYSQKDYWTDGQVWNYFFSNIKMIWNEHFLPGVFENHPMGGMNGSIWFITFQLRMYFLVALFAGFGVFRDRITSNIVFMIILVWVMISPETLPLVGSKFELYGHLDFPQYTITYCIASLLFLNLKNIKINILHVIIIGLGTIAFKDSEIMLWYWAAFFIVITLWLGTRKVVLKIKIPVDYSYGIYLYAWPTAQLVYELFPMLTSIQSSIVTLIFSMVLAMLSYRFIEIPAINISKKIIGIYRERVKA